jgi:Polyketide cyclase / dehydrase and lipid transport
VKPITVSVDVDRPREEVFAFLDVLSNHEPFTDHMLVDWSYAGPAAGVGARARTRAKVPGRADWIDMEVVASEAPVTTVEESVSAGGRRRTRGTYTLDELASGGTRVQFEIAFIDTLPSDRIAAPLLRAWLKRGNEKAMRRLGEALAE